MSYENQFKEYICYQVLFGLHTNFWPPTVLDKKPGKCPYKKGDIVTFNGQQYKVSDIQQYFEGNKEGIFYYSQNVWVDKP